MSRKRLSLSLVALMLFLLVSPALAGGWSVTTLDDLPEHAVIDEPVTLGFVVRQHGVRIVEGLKPVVSTVHPDNGDTFQAEAVEDTPGHYQVELIFPSEGVWEWSINAFGPEQPMPPLTVVSGKAASTRADVRLDDTAAEEALIERGSALFVGKGCAVCHQHNGVDFDAWATINAGPVLTTFSADEDYLSAWLANPSAVKSSAVMPDLDLDEEEIEALVAFLNAGEREHAKTDVGNERR